MTKKTLKFTKQLLIEPSAALPFALVFFLEVSLKGTTHV